MVFIACVSEKSSPLQFSHLTETEVPILEKTVNKYQNTVINMYGWNNVITENEMAADLKIKLHCAMQVFLISKQIHLDTNLRKPYPNM